MKLTAAQATSILNTKPAEGSAIPAREATVNVLVRLGLAQWRERGAYEQRGPGGSTRKGVLTDAGKAKRLELLDADTAHQERYYGYTDDTRTALRDDVDKAAYSSAEQNADDTAREEGFDRHSDRWYKVFNSTYDMWVDQNAAEREREAYYSDAADSDQGAAAVEGVHLQGMHDTTGGRCRSFAYGAEGVRVDATGSVGSPRWVVLAADGSQHLDTPNAQEAFNTAYTLQGAPNRDALGAGSAVEWSLLTGEVVQGTVRGGYQDAHVAAVDVLGEDMGRRVPWAFLRPQEAAQEAADALRGPVDVWATVRATGDRINYAHIPNGDPKRVAALMDDARHSRAFDNISTTR